MTTRYSMNSMTHSNEEVSKRPYQWNESMSRGAVENSVENFVENSRINRGENGKRVDRIADRLVAEYGAPKSRNFFCKVAWHLSEYDIDNYVYLSHRPDITSPLKFFVACCHRRMSTK